jgi:hypothetical protein
MKGKGMKLMHHVESMRVLKHAHTFFTGKTAASRLALGLNQPPIQWIPEVLSPGVTQPGREASHSPPSSAEFKKEWSYTTISPGV